MMLTLAKRASEMHAMVNDGTWANRLGVLPFDLYMGGNGADRRLRPDRVRTAALPGDRR